MVGVDIDHVPAAYSDKNRMVLLHTALYIGAVAIFSIGVGYRTFWRDEIWQLRLAARPATDLVSGILQETFNGAMSILVTALWTPLFGSGEAAARMPSVFALAATVPLLFAIASRFRPSTGVVAALLAVTSPLFFRYAQEVRPYAFAALFSTLCLLLVVRASERDGTRDWWLLGAGYLLLAYSHIYGLFVIAAQGAWLLFVRRRLPLRDLVLPVAVGLLPLPLVTLLRETEPYDWHAEPDLRTFASTVRDLFGGTPLAMVAVVGVLLSAAACLAVVRAKGWRAHDERFMLLTVCFFSLGVPPVAAYVVSQVKPIFLDRYLIVVLPAAIVLMAHGFSSLRLRWLTVGLTATAMVAGLLRFPDLPNFTGYEDARSAAEVVAELDRPGDLIVYAGGAALGFEFYADRIGRSRFDAVPLPGSAAWYGTLDELPDARTTLLESPAVDAAARVWLIGYYEDKGGKGWFHGLEAAIVDRRAGVDTWAFDEVRLALFE